MDADDEEEREDEDEDEEEEEDEDEDEEDNDDWGADLLLFPALLSPVRSMTVGSPPGV